MKHLRIPAVLFLVLSLLFPAVAEEAATNLYEVPVYANVFLDPGSTPVITENSYVSENIAIHITALRYEVPVAAYTQKCDVFIADIRVKDVHSFCRAFPGAQWGKQKQKLVPLSESAGAVLAMSGDSASDLYGGWLVFNGEMIRDGKKTPKYHRDLGILYENGEFVTLDGKDFKAKENKEALRASFDRGEIWQLFYFGPRLLDDEGHAMKKFNSDVNPANPRSVIGYYEPGHYCFVQVDGRSTKSKLERGKVNRGLTLQNLSVLMEKLGCKAAYNLDGGKTSQMYYDGQVISTPQNGGRKLGDIVLIREPVPAEEPSEQPAEESAEQPTEQPAEQSAEQPAEQSAEQPDAEPAGSR